MQCCILFVWLVSPDGIEALCKDVNVDHTDVRMLILAWYISDWILYFLFYFYCLSSTRFFNFLIYVFLTRKMNAEKQGYFTKVGRENIAEQINIV